MAPYKEDFRNGQELATLPILKEKPIAVRWAIGLLIIVAGAGLVILIGYRIARCCSKVLKYRKELKTGRKAPQQTPRPRKRRAQRTIKTSEKSRGPPKMSISSTPVKLSYPAPARRKH